MGDLEDQMIDGGTEGQRKHGWIAELSRYESKEEKESKRRERMKERG